MEFFFPFILDATPLLPGLDHVYQLFVAGAEEEEEEEVLRSFSWSFFVTDEGRGVFIGGREGNAMVVIFVSVFFSLASTEEEIGEETACGCDFTLVTAFCFEEEEEEEGKEEKEEEEVFGSFIASFFNEGVLVKALPRRDGNTIAFVFLSFASTDEGAGVEALCFASTPAKEGE